MVEISGFWMRGSKAEIPGFSCARRSPPSARKRIGRITLFSLDTIIPSSYYTGMRSDIHSAASTRGPLRPEWREENDHENLRLVRRARDIRHGAGWRGLRGSPERPHPGRKGPYLAVG